MSGHVDDLNEEQKSVLETFREKLSDVLKEEHDDRFLLQFLRARLFHIDDTEAMLREHLRWRKHFSVEYLTKNYKPPEFYAQHLRLRSLGFDDSGNLIRILRLGYSDLKGIVMGNTATETEEFLAHILTTDGYLLKLNREQTGNKSETVIYIGDFEDLNIYDLPWKYTFGILIRLVKMFEDNFPEHLKAVYLINCPTIVYYVLKALKPFMSEVTASKIRIYGKEGYQAEILKTCKKEMLPPFLGGTRCDTERDDTCNYLVTKSAKIPESKYFFRAKRLAVTQPDVIQVKVERRKSLLIDLEVLDEDGAIVYEVDVQNHDINVGLYLKGTSDDDLTCIKPLKRQKSIYCPLVGMHICEQPGKLSFLHVAQTKFLKRQPITKSTDALMLDNRYSYFTDKIVLYRIKVKSPTDKDC